jgi:hypothetical protein
MSATGNIYGNIGAITTVNSTTISASGNVTGGNILTAGIISAAANVTLGNLITGSGTGGNISGANVIFANTVSALANVIAGNVTTVGLISATGSITSASANADIGTATANSTYNLGTGVTTTGLTKNVNIGTGAAATSNTIITIGTALGTGNVTFPANTTVIVANTSGLAISAVGNITGGNITAAGVLLVNTANAAQAITNGAANGVGNIGSSTTYFNTVFAKSTSAQYADLAEMYSADAHYGPGTVVSFGGSEEITLATQPNDFRVAGVVSTNPSYLMNTTQQGAYVIAVALTGRVPCRVTGTVRKGDLMVTAGNGHACSNNSAQAGTIIGKSLEDYEGASGMIEVVVGRV